MGDSDTFTRKLKDGEQIYVRKIVKIKQTYQVLINSGNVMLYMASTKKCPVPSRTCY